VIKLDGSNQGFDRAKIMTRLTNFGADLNMEYLNFDVIVEKIQIGIYSGK
jgi:hypothetical protein